MGIRVLLIEDDATIAEPLAEGLGHFGLTVDHVTTGAEGLRRPYGDVVLLDLGLPDMDGIDVCRGIRQVSDVPVIILSARGEEADRVLGLELGADDYLAKPFSVRELVARVRAVTRRTQRTEAVVAEPVGTASPPSFETVTPQPLSYEATPAPAYDAPHSSPPSPSPVSSASSASPELDDTAPHPPYT
ncbi:response regulator transcription factor, partial [Streptomyces muensis]